MRTFRAVLCAVIMMAAAPVYSHPMERLQGEVSVEVVSDQGSAFLTIPHTVFWNNGARIIKKYLEARKGENYGIIIRNNTPERIGVVIAVDGRNIISGKQSELRNTEDMYLVGGNEQARYDGWRTAQSTVHRFYFTDTADSYAKKTFADTSAMGVIAVAVYREQDRPRPLVGMDSIKRKSLSPSPSAAQSAEQGRASGMQRDEAAGTGFGNEQYSPVTTVEFRPERLPVQKTLVKYEWREVLCRKGILNCQPETGNRLWDEGEFAPFPPGYQGKVR